MNMDWVFSVQNVNNFYKLYYFAFYYIIYIVMSYVVPLKNKNELNVICSLHSLLHQIKRSGGTTPQQFFSLISSPYQPYSDMILMRRSHLQSLPTNSGKTIEAIWNRFVEQTIKKDSPDELWKAKTDL